MFGSYSKMRAKKEDYTHAYISKKENGLDGDGIAFYAKQDEQGAFVAYEICDSKKVDESHSALLSRGFELMTMEEALEWASNLDPFRR